MGVGETNRGLDRINRYKSAVARHFPILLRRYIDTWSIQDIDAIALDCFIKHYPRKEVVVLDIGTFVGVSAFHFTGQAKVSRVISVDYNPTVAEMYDWGLIADDYEGLESLRLLNFVESALAEFSYEAAKIRLRGGSLAGPERVEVLAALKPLDDGALVAFVDGDHSEEGVRADLGALFESNPGAIAVLHDCFDIHHGTSVRAGIARFLNVAKQKYHFRPLEGLGTGVERLNLGIVYPDSGASEIEQLLLELR